MQLDDVWNFKNILSVVATPLTFILGLAGWHYKNVYHKVEKLEDSHTNLKVMVREHNLHLRNLTASYKKLDKKLDSLLNRL